MGRSSVLHKSNPTYSFLFKGFNLWKSRPSFSMTLYRDHLYPTSINLTKVQVKCTLVQALRLCTGPTAHRGSRGIALLFLDHGTRRGEVSASRPGRFLPRERPGTHCTGGWVGSRACLDRYRKSRPHRDSIPGPSNP